MRKLCFMVLAIVILSVLIFSGCAKSTPAQAPAPAPAPGTSAGAIAANDSHIIGEIKATRKLETGYPWEIKVFIQRSDSIGNLENPTRTKVGMTITTVTDEDMSSLGVFEAITANIKLINDPERGQIFYMYNIVIQGRLR